jgi:hypothetical protein
MGGRGSGVRAYCRVATALETELEDLGWQCVLTCRNEWQDQ